MSNRSKWIILKELKEAKDNFCKWLKQLDQECSNYYMMVLEMRTYAWRISKLTDELEMVCRS